MFLLAMTCLISCFTEHPTTLLICFKQKICKEKDSMAHFKVQAKSHIKKKKNTKTDEQKKMAGLQRNHITLPMVVCIV